MQTEAWFAQTRVVDKTNSRIFGLFTKFLYALLALLHQPFGCAGGPADAHALATFEPFGQDVAGGVHHVAARVGLQTLIEEYASVAALDAADEQHHVVAAGKAADALHAVGHLAADGIVIDEGGAWLHAALYQLHHLAEAFQRLGGLAVETDVTAEVKQVVGVVQRLDYDGCALGLAHETHHLGMSLLAEDDNLTAVPGVCVIILLDAFLQVQHHGAGGVNQRDVVQSRALVGLWRFAVGAEQYAGVLQAVELLVPDGLHAHGGQPVALAAVVHDVAQAIEPAIFSQLFLGLAYGARDAEAEAAAVVNLYLHASSTRCMSHSFCSSMVMWLLSSSRASSALRRGLTSRCESM